MIELGISSLDDDVLNACNRGTQESSRLQRCGLFWKEGFLSGAVDDRSFSGANRGKFSERSPTNCRAPRAKEPLPVTLRIYPCLVLDKTPLAELMRKGAYAPLSLEEGILRAAQIALRGRTSWNSPFNE